MKFLVDAQLPPRLAQALVVAGHDAVPTRELAEGNRSTDRTVAEAADAQDRVLVTKDGDFRDSHRLRGTRQRREAAAALSISRSKLYELMSGGRIGSVRIDGCRRVPVRALQDYVERLTEDGGDQHSAA